MLRRPVESAANRGRLWTSGRNNRLRIGPALLSTMNSLAIRPGADARIALKNVLPVHALVTCEAILNDQISEYTSLSPCECLIFRLRGPRHSFTDYDR
jgi:hypothetical protein